MTTNRPDDELLRSYLLGELPEPEADRLERRLLEEDKLFLHAEAVEADLLADCDRGGLAPEERERVLQRLASSPRGRERLALARSLNAAADDALAAPAVRFFRRATTSLQRTPARWASLAAAALLVVSGALWLARTSFPPPTSSISGPVEPGISDLSPTPEPEVPGPSAEPEPTTEPDHLAQEEGHDLPLPPERREPLKAAFELSLITLRDAEQAAEKFEVPQGTEIIEIKLYLEHLEGASFQTTIRNLETGDVWSKAGLKPRTSESDAFLVLEVPAKRLPAGHYQVTVSAGDEGESKDFDVVRDNE